MASWTQFRAGGLLWAWGIWLTFLLTAPAAVADPASFKKQIRPMLENYCFDCHADGANKGKVTFDEFKSEQAVLADRELWSKVLRNVRARIMPPAKRTDRPSEQEIEQLGAWIKSAVFKIDPRNPDPGRVTVRRLNRTEYRNTIRDLLGVDFDAQTWFPADDTGHGFDNNSDTLTLPPMLLEKYLGAAEQIVAKARPLAAVSKDLPADLDARRARAREFLARFSLRALRRPPGEATVERLAVIAEGVFTSPGKSFEDGIAQGMTAVLASPRFLFREETAATSKPGEGHPFVDEYSLASRLSYFLWSSMPDDELMRLAEEGRLRGNLATQLDRMLEDKRSQAFIRNFSGQWLRARDLESIPIDARAVLAREEQFDSKREEQRSRFRQLRAKSPETLSDSEKDELAALRDSLRRERGRPRADAEPALRRAMRLETEKVFDYVIRGDRSLIELIQADYTFLNETLARHYGITNISGEEMRLVKLPPDSPRGGVLTQGTALMVTSNPTRTSPVKRGLFLLDNILGTPPPPPPPDITPLEDAAKGISDRKPSLRETLALHREAPLCSSCHNRMDPLGLALENFNALGMWREAEFGEKIDATGRLITGEEFNNVRELKRILAENHKEEFYRTLTEKLLTYALGRGLEDYDVETVDQIVERILATGDRSSALLAGIVESAPFQKCRNEPSFTASSSRGQNVAANPKQ